MKYRDIEAGFYEQGHRHSWLQPSLHLSVTTATYVYKMLHQEAVSMYGCTTAAALIANCDASALTEILKQDFQ